MMASFFALLIPLCDTKNQWCWALDGAFIDSLNKQSSVRFGRLNEAPWIDFSSAAYMSRVIELGRQCFR